MKVMLISSNTAVAPYPVYPLGCSMLAASLERAGHEALVFDFLAGGESLEALSDALTAFAPGLVGISIRNIDSVDSLNDIGYLGAAREIVRQVRKISNSKIVLGGSGYSLIPEKLLERIGADYGIVGEAETLLVDFVDNAANGTYPSSRVIRSAEHMEGAAIKSARYDAGLFSYYGRHGKIGSVQSKRGCPWDCVYCTYPVLEGTKVRSRNHAEVVDDIERLGNEYKMEFLFFADSVFNDHENHYLGLLDEMIRRGLKMPWSAFITPRGIDSKGVLAMSRSGMVSAEIGADAATDTTLRETGKSFSMEDVFRVNGIFLDHDICPVNFFVFGGPGETEQSVVQGIENIQKLEGSLNIVFSGMRVLPKTRLQGRAIEEGLIDKDNDLVDSFYYFSPDVDKDWLNETLMDGLSGKKNCLYPPSDENSTLSALHWLKYSGSLWELKLKNIRSSGVRNG